MNTQGTSVLSLNGGSSSIRFAVYKVDEPLLECLGGKVDRIGLPGTCLTTNESETTAPPLQLPESDYNTAIAFLLGWLESRKTPGTIGAIGHRVVHGMSHSEPELITPALISELRQISIFDPDHLPGEIQLIETFQRRFPSIKQVACFDTAFHHTLPRVARQLPIPRQYEAMGIRRFGFHGISYSYLMDELVRLEDPAVKTGRSILAHLGNGASMAAVLDGKSIDTTMGFTPTGGLMMSTRSGDLDPGVAAYLARTENMSTDQFQDMVNHRSGMLGISESSSDMRDLLRHAGTDLRAAEAVNLFCYQAKKCLGAYAGALGGLDTLVFTGGIGENSPEVRLRICEGLGFLGIKLDEERNSANAPLISGGIGTVTIRVIRTNEERMIARSTVRLLGWDQGRDALV